MKNKYKVRIMRSEIRNIKNVAYDDVMYMNYVIINKKVMCDRTDIVCIYGHNGSPENRYIRLKGIEKNHNKREFYIRAITVGGQNEELYDEDDMLAMGYAFRKAGKVGTGQGNFEKRMREQDKAL